MFDVCIEVSFFFSISEGEGRPCLRLSPLYNGYYKLLPGLLPETVEFFCNQSYALSGSARRTCQTNGTWSGTQPICMRACREPKVSVLVKQRKHLCISFILPLNNNSVSFYLPPLPQGFHHVYTHIEYECMSPYYQHFGSAHRTCLKMGKWSGHHNPSETNWPWLAAIYRLPVTMGLVCSGALVNQRSVVVAAHCVTELGKLYPLDSQNQGSAWQTISFLYILFCPNYDPLVLDSDVAVLKLLDKVHMGEYVLLICLPDAHDTIEDSRQRMVTGWSLLLDQKAGVAEKACVGHVILGDIVQCEQQYANYGVPISVSENMLCGRQGSGAEKSNICPADTGGILILPPVSSGSHLTPPHGQGSQEWKLLGLVSFGYDSLNCNPELFTVYTHVANFVSFIEENMT
uniref:Uncharacterized protein n=1 Tax=Cyprinus carpio carpio TaxID=630221 RepID=A0A8C1CGP6_CYPCA